MSNSPESGNTAAVAELKKTDVNSQEIKDVSEDKGAKRKGGGVKIVEFEHGGGEIYVGEEENWVEMLKDSDVWKWHGKELQGRNANVDDGLRRQVHADGDEEIVWQDDVFNLKGIKEVPKVRGKGKA